MVAWEENSERLLAPEDRVALEASRAWVKGKELRLYRTIDQMITDVPD